MLSCIFSIQEWHILNNNNNFIVSEKQAFTSNLRPEFYSDFASSVTLPCHATGVPKPEISWYRNTEPLSIQIGSRFEILEDGSLTIKSVAVEDAGMFQCLAKNEAGEQSMYTWLRVKSEFFSFIFALIIVL